MSAPDLSKNASERTGCGSLIPVSPAELKTHSPGHFTSLCAPEFWRSLLQPPRQCSGLRPLDLGRRVGGKKVTDLGGRRASCIGTVAWRTKRGLHPRIPDRNSQDHVFKDAVVIELDHSVAVWLLVYSLCGGCKKCLLLATLLKSIGDFLVDGQTSHCQLGRGHWETLTSC